MKSTLGPAIVLLLASASIASAQSEVCPNDASTARFARVDNGAIYGMSGNDFLWLGTYRPASGPQQIRALALNTTTGACTPLVAVNQSNTTPIAAPLTQNRSFCFGAGNDTVVLMDEVTDAGAPNGQIPAFRHPRAVTRCTNISQTELNRYGTIAMNGYEVTYFLEGGNDRIWGELRATPAGREVMYGGEGDDWLVDGQLLFSSINPAWLMGGAGNDILVSGAGQDLLAGGPGNDILLDRGGNGDILVGNTGRDVLEDPSGFYRSNCADNEEDPNTFDWGPTTGALPGGSIYRCTYSLNDFAFNMITFLAPQVFSGPFGTP